MSSFAEVIFYAISLPGLVFGLIGICVYVVRSFRLKDPDIFPDALPWGYMGVGLLLAAAGFLASRAASTGAMPDVGDKCMLVFMFVAVSGGFGAALDVMRVNERWGTAWLWPLILSTLMGLSGGLSTVTF